MSSFVRHSLVITSVTLAVLAAHAQGAAKPTATPASQPTSTQTSTQSAPPEPTPVPAAPAEAAKPTNSPLMVGMGTAKFGLLLQYWLVNDTTGTNLNNRLRRAEIKLNGSAVENTRWFVMVDPTKQMRPGAVAQTNDNKILQDFGVGFSLTPEVEVVFGQFKTPTTAEGLDSSSELLLPERAYTARNFGDRREPGAMITYTTQAVKLSLMSSNGQGPNVDDTTARNEKDLHFRVDGTLSKELKIGLFTTAGDSETQTKARYGLNARGVFDALLIRLEGVRANDASVWTTGGVVDLAYQFSDTFQTVLRWDVLEGAVLAGNSYTAAASTLGVNYLIAKHNSKIQLAYTHLNHIQGGSASTVSSPGTYAPAHGVTGSTAILSAQAAF